MITYMREIFSKINSHKLRDKSGETLVETLVALIITTLALMMLPGEVVAAARVNARIGDQVIYMERTKDAANGTNVGTCDITFSTSDMKKSTVSGVQVTRFGNDKTGLYEIGLLQE